MCDFSRVEKLMTSGDGIFPNYLFAAIFKLTCSVLADDGMGLSWPFLIKMKQSITIAQYYTLNKGIMP